MPTTMIKVEAELALPPPIFHRLEEMMRDNHQDDISDTIVTVLSERFRLAGSEASRLLDTTQEAIVRRALEAGVVTYDELRDVFHDVSGNYANVAATNRKLRPRLGDKALIRNDDGTGFKPNPAVVTQLREILGMGAQHQTPS